MRSHVTPGKVYEWSKCQKLAYDKIRFSWKFENPRAFFVFVLQCTQIENVELKKKMGAKCHNIKN